MTAREQAREAAKAKQRNDKDDPTYLLVGADAASDVWEPLLRKVWEYRSRTVPQELGDLVAEALGE